MKKLLIALMMLPLCMAAQTKMTRYLFAYFNNNTTEGQQVCYAVSNDGVNFTPLNDGLPVIASDTISRSGGVRDPHILRGNDGWFYQVLTDMDMSLGKWTCQGIVMLRSRDLVHWQHHTVHFPERYSGTKFAKTNAVWAPQTIYDPSTGKLMVYFSLHSEKEGPFPQDAVYYAYANADFSNLEGEPQPLFTYPHPTIDTDIVKDQTGLYHLFFNTWGGPDGLQRRQYEFRDLHNQQAWTLVPGHQQPTSLNSEGSTAYQLADGTWMLSYDCFKDGVYQFCRTRDFRHYELVHETKTEGNFTPRHGSILQISEQEYQHLLKSYGKVLNNATIYQPEQRDRLYQSFLTPPDSIRVGYYWVNEQVDPEGVRKDLEWMKQNGITLAFLATDIRNRINWENPWMGQTFGKNKFQSRLWWKNLRTALKTAGELGIEMGLFNCPGWSQSGGPWVKPDEAMRNWTPQGIEVCKTNRGTDVVCSPCSPEAEGLEVDKLSKTHVKKHFEAFIGEILRRIPAEDRPTLTTVVVDSWERGKQNYTDSIFEKFQQRYGYPLDYQNEDCKKDLDRLIADLVASEYMGGLTEKAHEYGLRTWCEPYAHSPFPANSITYGSAADEVAAEFWVDDRKFRKKEVDAALGAARRSGKNRVWAESFTDGWPELAKDDWSYEKLKPLADRYFHAGINATILHVMISQPGDDRKPAVRPWFGTYFDRRSKNAKELKPLVEYLRRCNFMLQLGKPYNGATDCRILSDGTKIRFTEQSLFEVTFPDGSQENWNPAQILNGVPDSK